MSYTGVTILATAVGKSRTLQTLDLQQNQITDAGAKALAAAVEKSGTLQTLSLDNNQITDAGAIALATAVENSITLQTLHLYNNQITDAGAIALAAAVGNSRTLQALYLSDNQITDAGAIALATAVEKSIALQTLSLSNNSISDTGVSAIIAAQWRQPRASIYCDNAMGDVERLLTTVEKLNEQVKTPLLVFSAAVVKRGDKELSPAGELVDADGDHAVGRKVAEFLEGAPNLGNDQSKLLEQILIQHPRPN